MSERPWYVVKAMNILPCIVIAGIVLVPVGIGFLCSVYTTDTMAVVVDYTNCKDVSADLSCNNFTYAEDKVCVCYPQFQLKQDMPGKVTLYYEIDFDQTNATYASSRDNSQFTGHPSMTPAESCGDFRFDGGKPIFPCGEVADTIFNDTFSLLKLSDDSAPEIAVSYTGLYVGDASVAYHNPSDIVWQNFTKPKSWINTRNNKWEIGSNLTGVENEAFQAWMDTSLKRKPVFHVVDESLPNGLPAGNYGIRIDLHYPPDKYNGTRKFVLEGVRAYSRTSYVVIGSIALIVGLDALVFGVVLLIIAKKDEGKPSGYNDATLPVSARNRTTPNDFEDISEESQLHKDEQ